MSSHFQNRLVGVIVIVALGVIFLPDILDGKKQRQEEQFAEIPLRPKVEDATLPQQTIGTLELNNEVPATSNGDDSWQIEPAQKQDQIAVAVEPKTEIKKTVTKVVTTTPTASKTVAAPNASAWTIQLGSFNNAANVQALVKRLRSKGFTAYTLPTKPIDGQLTKVFVGPNISKDKLVAMQSNIAKLTKLKGRIVAYNPVEK
ncbi:SPOR domain-containing protein [Shewanella gelidimarina]|uniref:SPOR domain-containing protein n=1 Tax=Shewanella gelidimarina TaxID=56813 RepID=UPI00200DC6CB|nr:SPOR domain-containing protein [Shewanella gelidimarina]MCL1059284.1 SPOR domain-containing protein [Shewanella gelidimarina]